MLPSTKVDQGRRKKACAVRDPKKSAEWMFRLWEGGNATRRGSKVDADWRTTRTDPVRLAFLA
jgi:hypothetical protein